MTDINSLSKERRKNAMEIKKMKIDIEIVKIPKDLDGGYEARIPELGRATYRAWGRTKKEAIKNLKSTWRDIMKSVERLKNKTQRKVE